EERSKTIAEALPNLKDEAVLRRWLAELGHLQGRKDAGGGCDIAYGFAGLGNYELAYRLMQLHGCSPNSDRDFGVADRIRDVVILMVRAGKIDLALDWAARAPEQARYTLDDALIYGLLKAGRSDEALARLRATRSTPRVQMYTAVAALAGRGFA